MCKFFWLSSFLAILLFSGARGQVADTAEQSEATKESTSNRPAADINDRFIDPELDVTEWLGRFEIESREVYSARHKVIKACEIKAGMRIADVGAGTGFYSRLFAEAAGDSGWVYAVDISPKFLEHIREQAQQAGLANLTCILCPQDAVGLPAESVDLAFVCDTYHHFEQHELTLASIHRALKPGGHLVVIDFERIPGVSREWLLGHVRAGKSEFRQEIESAGFAFVGEVAIDGFEENYFLRFRKR